MRNGIINGFVSTVAKTAARAEIKIKKNSPEILLGVGIVGFIGTVVLACNATLRADEVLDHHKEKMDTIHEAKQIADQNPEDELEYDEKAYRQDVAIQHLKTAMSFAKLYAPSAALGALSLACILTSRNIMQKRYLGVVAAYNGLSTAFKQYRSRVCEELGEKMDRHFRYGASCDTIVEKNKDADGKTVKKTYEVENVDPNNIQHLDETCRFFDSSNPNWDPNPSFNLMWLRGQENYVNDLLHTRRHVFLNEVYDCLGFPHTPQGAVIGWILGAGDDYIDFGLYDARKEGVRRFVNGEENTILLEFNHDGIIWDKI